MCPFKRESSNVRPSRKRVKSNNYSCIPNAKIKAHVVQETYDQTLHLRTKDDKKLSRGFDLAKLSSATGGVTCSVQKCSLLNLGLKRTTRAY